MLTITRDNPAFRPVTIRIESQDDLDKLYAIIEAVASNRINHAPQLIHVLVDFRTPIANALEKD